MTVRMHLEDIAPSEILQSPKDKHGVIPRLRPPGKVNSQRQTVELWTPGPAEGASVSVYGDRGSVREGGEVPEMEVVAAAPPHDRLRPLSQTLNNG